MESGRKTSCFSNPSFLQRKHWDLVEKLQLFWWAHYFSQLICFQLQKTSFVRICLSLYEYIYVYIYRQAQVFMYNCYAENY